MIRVCDLSLEWAGNMVRTPKKIDYNFQDAE